MREDIRKRLDRLQWIDLGNWLPALAVLFVLFGCLLAVHTTVRKERVVAGVVTRAAWRLNEDTGQRYPDIHVTLDNKSMVRVGSFAPALPEVGERVKLRKRAMLLGYTTYQWDGPAPERAAEPAVTPVVTPVSSP